MKADQLRCKPQNTRGAEHPVGANLGCPSFWLAWPFLRVSSLLFMCRPVSAHTFLRQPPPQGGNFGCYVSLCHGRPVSAHTFLKQPTLWVQQLSMLRAKGWMKRI
eukprot:712049-Pelagomonas_calceolata.AAC.7